MRLSGHHPPQEEVRTLWEGCKAVTTDPEVTGWLAGRGLDPKDIARLDLARALPASSDQLPGWAWMGRRSWAGSCHRVIVRFWNPQLELATLHARAIREHAKPKGISPRGFEIQGTVMANRIALELLRSGSTTRRLLIAEGVPDWLTWSIWAARSGSTAPAVLGVISGSWTEQVAMRVPSNTRVLIRTHDDKAGHKYADKIAASLIKRCTVLRRVSTACSRNDESGQGRQRHPANARG